MKSSACLPFCLLLTLSACATVPGVDYQYTPAAGVLNISVIQSLACSKDSETLIISNAQPTVTTSYQPDTSVNAPWHILIKNDDSNTADTDFTMATWDGFRFKSVNSTSTGEGETILKDVITIAGVVALAVGKKPGDPAPAAKLPICTMISNLNKDGVVAITYSGQFMMAALADNAQVVVNPAPGSADLYESLSKSKTIIGPMKVSLTRSAYDTRPTIPKIKDSDSGYYWLKLQKVQIGTLQVLDQSGNPLSTTQVVVPSSDPSVAWSLPIPKPATFGKSTFALQVAESGVVTSVEYAKNASAPGMLNVFSSAATSATPQTAAEKLAALKTQDDLIAENNRHAKCIAQPDQCT